MTTSLSAGATIPAARPAGGAAPAEPAGSRHSAQHPWLRYLRLELVRMAADKRFLLLMLGMPVGMYLLFTNLPGADQPANGLAPAVAVMVSMAAYGAIGTALSATAPRIAQERTNGWARQLRVLPLSGRAVVAAKVAAAMLWAAPAIGLVFATAALDHGIALHTWQWAAVGGLLWVGTAPFAALGVLIGYLTDDSAAFAVMYGLYLFLGAAGGLWMPVSQLPHVLAAIARALPSNRLGELGWRVAAGHGPTPSGVLILVGWLVVLAAGAALLYRRAAATR